MRFSEKGHQTHRSAHQLFGVNFHDFIQKEMDSTPVELASEFGISVGDVQKLKKHLGRS